MKSKKVKRSWNTMVIIRSFTLKQGAFYAALFKKNDLENHKKPKRIGNVNNSKKVFCNMKG